jgi:putative restriction endonuclease
VDVALEAAHVKWRQAGGPDIVQNGLALCCIHHKALDAGAIAIDSSRRVVVSTSVHGTSGFAQWFMSVHHKPVRSPNSKSLSLEPSFARWHYIQVFRGGERD